MRIASILGILLFFTGCDDSSIAERFPETNVLEIQFYDPETNEVKTQLWAHYQYKEEFIGEFELDGSLLKFNPDKTYYLFDCEDGQDDVFRTENIIYIREIFTIIPLVCLPIEIPIDGD